MSRLEVFPNVDTMVARLAAALGKPVWVILTHAANRRWVFDREDGPWHPTMRLFRQPTPGDWGEVARRVAEALGYV